MTFRYLPLAALLLAGSVAIAQAPAGPGTDPKAVAAGTYAVEPYHTRVQFAVSHMGFSDWYGDFTGVAGSLAIDPARVAAAKLDITIPTASLSTTNARLDDELKGADWLGAAAYPTIRFVSTRIVQTAPGRASITGDLTFHGVTRPVTLAATFNGVGTNPLDKSYTVGFNATGALKRSAFGVTKYVPLIGDDVTLRISAAFVKPAA